MSKRKQYLREALAELLDKEPHELSLTSTFAEQGVDSLIGLRLARKIHDSIQVEVDLEWLFDYPTIELLSGFLEERFGALPGGSD